MQSAARPTPRSAPARIVVTDDSGFMRRILASGLEKKGHEIIGEAAKRIPDDIRSRQPDIDWRGMAGLRDVIIHQYDRIDPGVPFHVATAQLPAMIDRLGEVMRFFDLSDRQAHRLFCDCHYHGTMTGTGLAARLRTIARGGLRAWFA